MGKMLNISEQEGTLSSATEVLLDDSMVKYENVTKSFGDTHVLRGINLDIPAGQKVALIGSSGSGKTTLLRMLMTLERPTSGSITLDGELLWHREVNGQRLPANEKHLHRMRRKVGMVFQQFNLFPHMKILRNVTEAPIRVLKMSKEEAEQRAKLMLDKVGLGNKLDAYPAQLSGGQQQRVAIARALVMRPKVMLFDEVTSALDPELVGEVLSVIKDIAKEGDTTMLLVTHEMAFARDVADRVLFLDEGKIVEDGSPREMLENPQNERLKTFLSRFRNQ